LIVWKYSSRRI